jgi:hypothetical protein
MPIDQAFPPQKPNAGESTEAGLTPRGRVMDHRAIDANLGRRGSDQHGAPRRTA